MGNKRLHYAWFILLGVILIRGFAGGGINMTSSLFLPSVSEELHVGIGSLSVYHSIISIVTVFWLPAAGRIINKYDIRIVAAAGVALQALSFAAMGLMNRTYGWYLLAVPYACGATIVVSLLGPVLINRWFSKNAGLMIGIQMAFVGVFGAVMQPLASHIIVNSGWRRGYYIIGGIALLGAVAAIFLLLRNRPAEKGLLPYGAAQEEKNTADEKSSKETLAISEKEAVRSASFYLLLFFMIAITGIGVFTQHIPTYGSVLGYPLQETGAVLAYASVGNAAGSVIIGMVSDRVGGLKTCYGMIAVGVIAVIGFLFCRHSFLLFGISAFMHGLVSSGIMVLAPVLTLKFYGRKDYEKIYARVSMGAPLASILLIPAYGYIYDLTDSYTYVLLGMLVLLAAAAFCIAKGWKKRCTLDGCPGFGEEN